MPVNTRIYMVTQKDTGKIRLVDAISPSRAVAHVARSMLDVKVASTYDVADAMHGGDVMVEADAALEPRRGNGAVDTHTQALPL